MNPIPHPKDEEQRTGFVDPSLAVIYGRRKDKRPNRRKTQFFVTFCHWSIVALLVLNLLTGMRIRWGFVDSPLGGPQGTETAVLNAVAPKGTLFGVGLISLHVICAWLLLLNATIYIIYMFRSRASHRLRLTWQDLNKVIRGIRASGFWKNKIALWSANVVVYWLAFTSIIIVIITGYAQYRLDWGLDRILGGYKTVRLLHTLAAYVFIPYVVLHVVLQWFFGTIWSVFKAKFYSPHLKAGCVGIAIALPVVGGFYIWDNLPETLVVKRIPVDRQVPVVDGDPNDPIWTNANMVTVRTVKGINNQQEYVDIRVKALHNGQRVYFQFQWADHDVSSKRFPLIKTAQGWKVLQTRLEESHEDVYYEDKLALYITDKRNGSCAATCHLGEGLAGNTKGVHYTAGEIGDVWHWKWVRTDPMGELTGEPGYMDDQYFAPPDPLPDNPKTRYTGGYHPDPKTGGGYRLNFVKIDPDKPLAETYVRPIKLPSLLRTANVIVDLTTSEHGIVWWIHESEGIPYSEEADCYPINTLIPNILIAPLQGDRADVRGKGDWRDGRWTLEAIRVLDTQSKYDVALTPGKPVYLSIAAFNRTQTRHSEHIKPVRLILER